MSVEQYQRTVNSLDKEIAELEKKKAAADKKAADESKKAESVSISKNASATTIKSKLNEIDRHNKASNKAATESAEFGKKIADKRAKRNDAYLKLQKEQQKEQKAQQKVMDNIKKEYENRIAELEKQSIPSAITYNPTTDDVNSIEQYDVFISHAWEDKEDFVDELYNALTALGIKVWYDTSKIKWGDSMRKKIDEGLKKSKFGIIVLSPNYIAENKYWTKIELDGLFQLESINGKAILPIWHKLTKKEVMEYSPIIASKLAMTTATMTAEDIASFCRSKEIRCIIDAAHPFAENLHQAIAEAALPVIRLGRNLGRHMEGVEYCHDYADAVERLRRESPRRLLALTGVNSIARLKEYWLEHPTIFRILNRAESLAVADDAGFPRAYLIYYREDGELPSMEEEKDLMQHLGCDALLTKQSGGQGGFAQC